VSIQADLHYLHVRTTRGRATILASMSAAETALGELGLRVHRSHWIALAHVARVARTARGTILILSDGARVPVSRRRSAEVQARLGRDFVIDAS
jgi:DNA-binding LytR/AlgR family response regulator